jgi:hypothetical protein
MRSEERVFQEVHPMRSPALILCLLTLPAIAGAAEEEGVFRSKYENAVTVQPIDLFTGTLNIEYERVLAKRIGAYGAVNFMMYRPILYPSPGSSFGLGPEIGLRVYLIGNAPAGLWIGPYINALWVRNVAEGYIVDSLGLGAGGMAGVNLVFGHFLLSLGGGVAYVDHSAYRNDERVGAFGLTPRLRLAVGAAF